MSTIGYESWAVDMAEVGAIYPFQGWEIPMTIIGVLFCENIETIRQALKSRQSSTRRWKTRCRK